MYIQKNVEILLEFLASRKQLHLQINYNNSSQFLSIHNGSCLVPLSLLVVEKQNKILFDDVTPCHLVDSGQHFKDSYCFPLLRGKKNYNYTADYRVLHSRRTRL